MSDDRFPCPCCGYLILAKPSPGSYELCPICCWEDSNREDDWTGSNEATLAQAKANFQAFGACEEAWLDVVRAPTDDDERVVHWQTVEALDEAARQAAVDAIEAAFGGLRRGDGMRIYDAEMEDNYGLETEDLVALRYGNYQSWHAVPDEQIEQYYSVLSFFDPPGLRFHLAAYMTWSLTHPQAPHSNTANSTIFELEIDGRDEGMRAWALERFEIFDAAQSRAVALFLRFMGHHAGEGFDHCGARRALGAYWSRFETGERDRSAELVQSER